jgi:lipopolysaccharide transport system permease protein
MTVLWKYRKFILQNAVNDLRHRYAGSTMGVFWNVLNPLSQILVYTLVFSNLMKAHLTHRPSTAGFAVYLCSGLLPWTAFAESVVRGTGAFVSNAHFLKKLPVPEQVFVAQSALASTLNLLVSMVLLFGLNVSTGSSASLTWFLVPIILLLFQGLAFGLGVLLGSLNVFFRDIGQIVAILLQLWMWLNPIVYLKTTLPAKLQAALTWNPTFAFIDSIHDAMLNHTVPEAWKWGSMFSWALGMTLVGYAVMRRLRPEIRDVV